MVRFGVVIPVMAVDERVSSAEGGWSVTQWMTVPIGLRTWTKEGRP
jgi:hypothetical protein